MVKINLALQGGGAHGAFTWGVLDRLLEDGALDIAWVSATSAGAVNAVALASGLAEGGRLAARETLAKVWGAVIRRGVPDLAKIYPMLASLSKLTQLAPLQPALSPYEFNPLGFDPLRRVLEETIDFERIRTRAPVELLIAATDIRTSRARLFRRAEMRLEAVLASACLPTLHHAVEIGGRLYWDGGFSANPDLVTLASESPVADTLIVELNPVEIADPPRTSRDIAAHVNHVTFAQPLLRDVEQIVAAQEIPFGLMAPRASKAHRLARHRFHLIEAGPVTGELEPSSKVSLDAELIELLFKAGRAAAGAWLEQSLPLVGKRASVDLKARYFSPPPRPKLGGLATRPRPEPGDDDPPPATDLKSQARS